MCWVVGEFLYGNCDGLCDFVEVCVVVGCLDVVVWYVDVLWCGVYLVGV